jgi:hypothetical protein
MSEVTDLVVAKKLIHLAQSAKDRNLEFNLSFKTVKRLMSVKKCYYTSVEFEEQGANCRTIDRIDASLGYIEGNVVACTNEFNGKKCNLTVKEIELLYKKVKRFL